MSTCSNLCCTSYLGPDGCSMLAKQSAVALNDGAGAPYGVLCNISSRGSILGDPHFTGFDVSGRAAPCIRSWLVADLQSKAYREWWGVMPRVSPCLAGQPS